MFALDILLKNNVTNLDLAETYFNLGSALVHSNSESALDYFRKALELKTMFLDDEDPQVVLLNNIIRDMVFKQSNESEFPFEFLDFTNNKEIY